MLVWRHARANQSVVRDAYGLALGDEQTYEGAQRIMRCSDNGIGKGGRGNEDGRGSVMIRQSVNTDVV